VGSLPKSLPRPRMPGFIADRLDRSRSSSRGKQGKGRSLPSWPVLRRRLILVGLIAVALLAAYMFWFRTSSFVAVEDVQITGAEEAPDVDAALRAAADGQSTLHVDLEALEAAVAEDPLVSGITVDTDFPHTMLIDVDARTPVAYLGAEEAVVAADGVILDHTGDRPDGLPGIEIDGDKSSLTSGDAVTGDALEVSRVIGAAPGPLADQINEGAMTSDYGVTVDFGPGIELRFGDAASADLKWKAVAAVLADPKFEGAGYLDLSVPDRPVAGGIPEEAVAAEAPAEEVAPVEPEVPVEPVAAVDPAATTDTAATTVP
jgi:cell division septal protein FtsQ